MVEVIDSKEQVNANTSLDAEIPVSLSLGGATLWLSDSGQWTFDHVSLQQTSSQCEYLKKQVVTLENDNQQLRNAVTRITEESDMSKFKCKLMVEMLAVQSLEEEKAKEQLELERKNVQTLKNDILSILDRNEPSDVQTVRDVLDTD
uniref:AlNc14C10G1281 protein n=1 Tax=Albugo laibachii Nc14 TaxID=890382 RepID=F0W2P1_9STRA|nr:AlNc14C10G1281 [Albugo laibachii Nc14]|eukprot:CCA15327.1 AlNc14C10G1281 [Albugo laibachii Nc14]